MTENRTDPTPGKTIYPMSISFTLIAAAVVLSFVDLMFLNDVIGKILDLGTGGSMVIAFALGMVGILIMAHQGVKVAHGTEVKRQEIWHYALWVSLGFAFVMIRFFSASILLLDGASDKESLITVLGMNVREVDLVLAPLMLFLYFATGIMVKDGVKHLLLNPELETWRLDHKKSKDATKQKEDRRRKRAEERTARAQGLAQKAQAKRTKDMELSRQKQKEVDQENSIKETLNGNYEDALHQYNAKLKEMKEKYQTISSNIDYVENMDKQEKQFELAVKPGLLEIVQGSIDSVQNSIVLAIRKKTGEDIAELCSVVDTHNKQD